MKNKKPRKRKQRYACIYSKLDWLNASDTLPLSEERQAHHVKPSLDAIKSIQTGTMTNQDWCDCYFVINLMWQLLKIAGYEERSGLLDDAMDAMDASTKRKLAKEDMTFTADEFANVSSIIFEYVELIKTVPEREMVRVYSETEVEINNANKRTC